MSKKVKIILINLILLMIVFTTKVSAYSADVNLTTDSKLIEGGDVEITLKLENIDATSSGISVIKGKITYDTDVFESYTLETNNGWSKENSTDTFIFEKQEGVTTNEVVATIRFKVKSSISKESAQIQFSNITASGITKQNGGPGDIKVAGATIKLSKTEEAVITKNNNTTVIKSSKSNSSELPHAGEETNKIIKLIVLVAVVGVIYINYRKYKDIK